MTGTRLARPRRRLHRGLLALTLGALILAALPAQAQDQPASWAPAEQQFVNKLNEARQAEGLAPLRVNLQMVRIARDWSREMGRREEMLHRPRLAEQVHGPWQRLGENVGWTTVSSDDAVPAAVERLHQAFLASPGHRANVMGQYNHVGVGVVIAAGRLWVTVNFLLGPVGEFPLFRDSGRTTHEANIERVWLANVANGCQFSRYCPDQDVTRAQMAVFLGRALQLQPVVADQFQDVDPASPFSGYINAIARAGIALGCGDGRFCPARAVSRAEMATFIARARQLAPEPEAQFVDVPPTSVHFENINAIAEAGITAGCDTTGLRYCPDASVPREQMASFLSRAFQPPLTFWEAPAQDEPTAWGGENQAAQTELGDPQQYESSGTD